MRETEISSTEFWVSCAVKSNLISSHIPFSVRLYPLLHWEHIELEVQWKQLAMAEEHERQLPASK